MLARLTLPLMSLTFVVVLAACGETPVLRHSEVIGANARVDHILLRGVYVAPPASGHGYPPGGDPLVWLTVINDGDRPDALVRVDTPYAGEVEIRWDRTCDGTAEPVDRLPLRPTNLVNATRSQTVPPFDAYHLRVVDLDWEVLAGTTIPLTFTFANAGQVTVHAIVVPNQRRVAPPTDRCAK
jgi:copper(I)-binding protein